VKYISKQCVILEKFKSLDSKDVFVDIYKNKVWGDLGNGSGSGSEPGYTYRLRETLNFLIKEHHIISMCDCPCGAGKWVNIFLQQLTDTGTSIKYTGIDVVENTLSKCSKVLEHHNKFHELSFLLMDITKDKLPQGYDMILCRDTMQHLSYSQIISALQNIAEANAKWVIIGGYFGDNKNIITGQYFDFNILEYPFMLRPYAVFSEHHLGLKENMKHLFMFKGDYFSTIDWISMKQRCDKSSNQSIQSPS
jgi:hypothetical protein